MKRPVDHVLLTRFNLPSGGAESRIRAREDWLEKRACMFEAITVPSVRGQTADVRWIVYLDPHSPVWLKERMQRYEQEALLLPLYREEVPRSVLVADLHRLVQSPAPRLITTNLDNDDGLAIDFAESVQKEAGRPCRYVIYADNGVIRRGTMIYARRDPRNAFVSVSESWTDPMTCWSAWHNQVHLFMPAVHIDRQAAWLQTVHDDNVSNRVRGLLVSPDRYADVFPELLKGVRVPTRRELLADMVVQLPARAGRDLVRTTVRNTVMRLAGQQGLEALHACLRRQGARSRHRTSKGGMNQRLR